VAERDVQLPSPTTVPHFLAKQIGPHLGGPAQEELAEAIQEIELETEIDGASFIKVSILDPEGALQESGFFDPDADGLLPAIEVEYPEKSGWFWRFCAIDGGNSPTEPVVLTFEDRIVAYLRDHSGQRGVPPGTTTRAQFVKALVDEVGLGGKVSKINFVCPSLKVVQPVASSKTSAEGTTTVSTALDQSNANAEANKSRGIAAGANVSAGGVQLTAHQRMEANTLLGKANAAGAPVVAVEALIFAAIAESKIGDDAGSYTPNSAGYYGVLQGSAKTWPDPHDTAGMADAFLHGGKGFQSGGAIALARTVSDPVEIAVRVEAPSIWPANAYAGEAGYSSFLPEAKAIIAAGGGVTTGGTGSTDESDVGQLTRGTPDNPYEDSWDCINRLKAQVNWFAFTNGNNLFYMDGPDLIGQKPSLYLDVWANQVTYEKGSHKIEETGVIQTGLTYTFDNTAFTYFKNKKKSKSKVQHKSRIAKPQTPSQVRLNLVCEITAFRAGDVFVFQKGPLKGRRVVATATRKCLGELFTQFLLEPPLAPTPEPLGGNEAQAASFGSSPVAGAARKALSEKSKYVYSEGANRGNNGTLFGPEPRTMDCSSFAILCYKEAGLPDPSGANYNPIGNTDSLIHNMKKTSTPQPGCLCFFGASVSATTHVTVYVGGGNAISMGRQGDPEEGPAETTGAAGFLGYWEPK
jgi:hypothetical protein